MKKENKKFYELNDEEQKERAQAFWKKAKPILKRVLFAIFCVAICLLMVVGLLYNIIWSKKSDDDHNHDHAAIVLELDEMAA